MNDNTATAAKPALPSTRPVVPATKPETKAPAPLLKISKLSKDCSIDIETTGNTTTIKLDKYRIEIIPNIKIKVI